MKRLFYAVSLCIAFSVFVSCATTGKKLSEPLTYSEIIEVENISKSDLFTRANMWFVDMFKNADSVIQYSDKESGVIKGKYIDTNVMVGMYICKITSTITVEVRDNRCRISFTDPIYQYTGDALNGVYRNPGTSGAVETIDLADKVSSEWKVIASSLKEGILVSASDW